MVGLIPCPSPDHVSSVTVTERIVGYSVLWHRSTPQARLGIESARRAYLSNLADVVPMDSAIAIVSGEVMGLLPDPPSPPRKSHRSAETRHDRLARWRFDTIIAATALVIGLPLLHNNGVDFEAIAPQSRPIPSGFRAQAWRFALRKPRTARAPAASRIVEGSGAVLAE